MSAHLKREEERHEEGKWKKQGREEEEENRARLRCCTVAGAGGERYFRGIELRVLEVLQKKRRAGENLRRWLLKLLH